MQCELRIMASFSKVSFIEREREREREKGGERERESERREIVAHYG
jgi:hypothetical protein